MTSFKEMTDQLEPRLKLMSNFKIGKTGQSIKDRYDKSYSDKYSFYAGVGSSTKAEAINKLEKYLIDFFKDYKNCDNEQVGVGDMEKSEKYIVYVVYNE